MKRQIPNLITLLNLFFGCLAIMSAFEAGAMFSMDDNGGVIIEIPAKLYYASLYIGLAGLMDFFDGFAARILKVGGSLAIKDYSHVDKISDGEYIESWEYMIYPMSKILQKAELLNLRLDFMIHPEVNVQKCHVFLANSKLKDWHDIDYKSGRTMLCKFTKI